MSGFYCNVAAVVAAVVVVPVMVFITATHTHTHSLGCCTVVSAAFLLSPYRKMLRTAGTSS